MSFILDALNKKQSDQNTQDESLSLNSLSNSLPNSSVNSSANASLQMHDFDRTAMVPEFRPQSIAWGVLLTLAIFLALAMGFWFGSHSQPLNTQTVVQLPVPEANVPSTTAQAVNRQTDPAFQAIEPISATSKSTVSNASSDAKVAKIPAEDYFENPPVKTVGNTTGKSIYANSENAIVEHTIKVQTAEEKLNDIKFNVEATDGVSNNLLSLFQSAINETNTTNVNSGVKNGNATNTNNEIDESIQIRQLSNMPAWVQNGIPRLDFSMHIYASDGAGWVRVNGEDKVENDFISTDVQLIEILPQKVVLSYRGERFSMQALSSW